MQKVNSVDEYIEAAPKEHREKLEQIRQAIRTIIPEAEEKMSYGMPYYGYKGRLAYFALAKKHLGLYIPPPIISDHAQELKKYVTSVSAVQFPLEEDLPLSLIQKLVKARIKHNEESAKKK